MTEMTEGELLEYIQFTDDEYDNKKYNTYGILAELDDIGYDEDTHDAQFLDAIISKHSEFKEWEVAELFFVREDGDDMETHSNTWTTNDRNDFEKYPHIDSADSGEDAYDRDGMLVTIYRYEND